MTIEYLTRIEISEDCKNDPEVDHRAFGDHLWNLACRRDGHTPVLVTDQTWLAPVAERDTWLLCVLGVAEE